MKRINKFKIFIISFLILLTSGCTVDYNLKVNEDLSVTEIVNATESTKVMQSKTGLKGDQAVSYLFDMFTRYGEDISFSSKEENENTIATASASHNSIEDYSYHFFSDVFKGVTITKEKSEITLVANQKKQLGGNGIRVPVYDEIIINLNIPFNVTYNNADKVNGDIYTWNIKKNQKLKNIKIVFDTKKEKDAAHIDLGKEVLNIKYEYIGIGALVLIISIIIIVVAIKNKKNNRV